MVVLKALICVLPWFLKKRVLKAIFKYQIHPKAKIGLSWIYPDMLVMEEGAYIGHFNIAIHLDLVEMKHNSKIGRGNWITGFSTQYKSKHFNHQPERQSILKLGMHTAVTKHHHLDCTNVLSIGNFCTIAGYSSQFLTHSIDVYENRQSSAPINIGDYTFVSTNVVVLGGAVLPSYSVLGAKALLNKAYSKEWTLYGGVPAKSVRDIDKSAKYFNRKAGFVN